MDVSSPPSKERLRKGEAGSVLVEFALISIALYLILAGIIDFGAMFLTANIVQSAAHAAAVSLASTEAAKTAATFGDLLANPEVFSSAYDPTLLEVHMPRTITGPGPDLDAFVASWPPVNRLLFRTVMLEDVASGDADNRVFRYPGTLPTGNPADPWGIPQVTHDADGIETITCCMSVIEGDIQVINGQTLIDVRLNYPYQAATLSGFRPKQSPDEISNMVGPNGELGPYEASDAPLPGETPGPYSGPNRLGNQYAFAKGAVVTVRPYRKLLTEEAMERVLP